MNSGDKVELFALCALAVAATACEGSPASGDAQVDGGAQDATVDTSLVSVCADETGDFQSIQQAIDAVSAGGIIEVCPGTYRENLVMEAKPLIIRSLQGRESTIVEAAAAESVVRIREVHEPGVAMQGLSIRGGQTEGPGGGIHCLGSTFALTESEISGNSASEGGGLAARDCSLTVSGNRFSANTASGRGGGASVVNSEGIFEDNGVSGNQAEEGGGLAVVSAGSGEPSERSFSSTGFEVRNNTISGNSASPPRDILYNVKESGGGGIWLQGNSPLNGNIVTDNRSSINGAGIYAVNGVVEIVGNQIRDNQTVEDGGGLYANTCGGRIADNTISGNMSFDDAGGLRIFVGLDMLIENNTIEFNFALDASGGVKLSHAQNRFFDNLVRGNRADTAGGLELDNDSSLVRSCTFMDNQARLGAAIHSKTAERPITIQDTVFENNVAEAYGGALHFENDAHQVLLSGITASGNQAQWGGAIATNNSRLELTDSVLSDNRAAEGGGALFLSGYEEALAGELSTIPVEVTSNQEEPKLIMLRRVEMIDNSAGSGGALQAVQDTWLDLANLVVAGNRAEQSGGGLQLVAVNGVLANLVVAGNAAPSAAGIELGDIADLEVYNSIVTGNGESEGVLATEEAPGYWKYNNVYDNQGGDYAGMASPIGAEGNISRPPGFLDAAGFDFHLEPDSECVDAGDPELDDADGTRSDMGAYGGPGGEWRE